MSKVNIFKSQKNPITVLPKLTNGLSKLTLMRKMTKKLIYCKKTKGDFFMLKKIKNFKMNHTVLNALVMVVCLYSANSRCCWLLHQPNMPEEMKQFKRF